MITAEHVIEVALMLLLAYLAGCVLGYFAHVALRAFAARPRFENRLKARAVAVVEAEIAPKATAPAMPRSAARRLAGAVDRDEAVSPPVPAAPALQRPPDLPAPRGGKADDLRKIKGIGPKTESALNDLGIYHYDQIAAWTRAHVDWLEGRIAVKGRIRREQWVEQAILLATATEPV